MSRVYLYNKTYFRIAYIDGEISLIETSNIMDYEYYDYEQYGYWLTQTKFYSSEDSEGGHWQSGKVEAIEFLRSVRNREDLDPIFKESLDTFFEEYPGSFHNYLDQIE